MLYDLHNPLKAARVFHDGDTPVWLTPGETRWRVELRDATVSRLNLPGDVTAVVSRQQTPDLPAIVVTGMWGIGDCLHQRAPIRELMKVKRVWLTTCNWHINSDLVDQGLNLIFDGSTRLRGQQLSIKRERALFMPMEPPPKDAWRIKLWYRKDGIDKYGSILETMFANCFIEKPARMDFSWPIRPEWRARAKELIATWGLAGRPLMVYRPIVFRPEWKSANRNPEPRPYAELFEVARRGYFVVSFAYLHPIDEVIVGPEASVDLKFHKGEIPIEIIAAVVAEAQLVYCNAGFGPVMAQAVGTPSIVVYGGRESFRTTQRAGAHLAPTLGVDVDRPCDCHTERHDCDKRLTTSKWIDRVAEFAEKYRSSGAGVEPTLPVIHGDEKVRDTELAASRGSVSQVSRSLIFATVYVDSPERQKLTAQWLELTMTLNPDCDILLVDSASPIPPLSGPWVERFRDDPRFQLFDFGDNIGHLSRRGRDGWGRAFCKGLELAIEGGYEYAVHIEGDSLLRLPVSQLIDDMRLAGKKVATTKVCGMPRDMPGWVETGLMVFDVAWVKAKSFIARYEWPRRLERPTPELVVAGLIAGFEFFLPIKAQRSDKKQITHQNVVSLDLDWITHCHEDIWCYDRFLEAALGRVGAAGTHTSVTVTAALGPSPPPIPTVTDPSVKLNLGCGTNKLPGWENHDADVDITRPLPWPDNSADFIFIEHCVEHVSFHQAIRFFEQAFRVLKPGGVLRVTVPSLEQIALFSEADYWKFTEKWGGEPTLHGALKAILFAHGHQQAWTASLMRYTLAYAGFIDIEAREVGKSPHPALRGVEGHGKVIGEAFNVIESMPFEGTKPGGVKKKFLSRLLSSLVGRNVSGKTSPPRETTAKNSALIQPSLPPTIWSRNSTDPVSR